MKKSIMHLLYERDELRKSIEQLDILSHRMFHSPEIVNSLYSEDTPEEKRAHSLEISRAKGFLESYLSIIEKTLNATEVVWPPIPQGDEE